MSLKDDVGEISENNVTIAEKQEKVYNAGVRAGMMQDPDYSEGYEDGYEQGLSDSSGVVWEDLLSGKVPVGKAKEADHADKATNAENAENAKKANHAASATNADHATNADNASHAESAAVAGHAESAAVAGHASTADSADHASTADSATNAGHATTATTAKFAQEANTPPWNVDRLVGAISPTIDMDTVNVECGDGGRAEDDLIFKEAIREGSTSVSIPMINSGKVYLDFDEVIQVQASEKEVGTTDRYTRISPLNWQIKVKININTILAKELTTTAATEESALHEQSDIVLYINRDDANRNIVSYETTKKHRVLLSVTAGDIVRIEASTIAVFEGNTIYNPGSGDSSKHTIKNIQLKANILTPNTYHSLDISIE